MQRQIPDLPAASAITVFYENICSASVLEELSAHWVHTLPELYGLTYRCAQAEEAGIPSGAGRREHGGVRPGEREPFVVKVTFNEDGSRSVLIGADLSDK